MKRLEIIFAMLMALSQTAIFVPKLALAAPGDLDTSFGATGVVTHSEGGAYGVWRDIVLLPDGRIWVGGGGNSDMTNMAVVASYVSNGLLDSGFDGDGILVPQDTASHAVSLHRSALQDVGGESMLVVGETYTDPGPTASFSDDRAHGIVARYRQDGTRDTTFGAGGQVDLLAIFPSDPASYIQGLKVASDGKIIALTGSLIIRLNADGSPDTAFGGGGSVANPSGIAGALQTLNVLSDGKVLLAGNQFSPSKLLTYRLNSDGTLDASFQNGSKEAAPFQTMEFLLSGTTALHTVGADAGFLVSGHAYCGTAGNSKDCAFVARFHADGSVDASFGTGGVWMTQDMIYGRGLGVQSNGKIVVGTEGNNDPMTLCGIEICGVLFRLDPAGALDTGFGSGGTVAVPQLSGLGIENGPYAIAIDSSGRILVGGASYLGDTTHYQFTLARYFGDPPTGGSTGGTTGGGGGSGGTTSGGSSGGCSLVRQ